MITNDCIESALSELQACGIAAKVEHGGKHVAIKWEHGGRERTYYTAATPSDRRAPLNVRSDIRRLLRSDGFLNDESFSVHADPLIFLRGGQFFCNSRNLADHFGKHHKDVLRSIDNALLELGEFGRRNFTPSSYLNEQNKEQRCFDLTRDGFSYIAMGFTGSAAAEWKVKYLTAFNVMEDELRGLAMAPQITPDVAARLARVEEDLAALIDLCLEQPKPKPGFIIVPAHYRKTRAPKRKMACVMGTQ
ncbi:MAG: hypothetical protein EKK40_07105 [Bradyrhizobiaceae bacterium]|nr:MAG: hypothetical protein EKK40_07105 [Bradyrhizobiaceae bacterium]